MYNICPRCGSIAEYNAYYGRITCTSCNWESKSISKEKSKRKYKYFYKIKFRDIV